MYKNVNNDTWAKILNMIKVEYSHAKCSSFVRKPLSYALYQVWKYVDSKEYVRGSGDSDEV